MILSRSKPAIVTAANADGSAATKKHVPTLEEFLTKRDYSGAISLLDFNRSSNKGGEEVDMWLGYAAFHAGDYKRAMLEFEALTRSKKVRLPTS